MTPVEALIAARRAGASVLVGADGKLHVRSDERLPDELKATLREHASRLLQLLTLQQRPRWGTFDGHDCWTGCERLHTRCNACGAALRPQELHWPWLHNDCHLERFDR